MADLDHKITIHNKDSTQTLSFPLYLSFSQTHIHKQIYSEENLRSLCEKKIF